MPSYPPRTNPVKKQEELSKRETELLAAIRKNLASDKLVRSVDKYRQAQLSILKARMHQFRENEFQGKSNDISFEKLEDFVKEWNKKTNEEIISEIKKLNNQ